MKSKKGFTVLELCFVLILMGVAAVFVQKLMLPNARGMLLTKDNRYLEQAANRIVANLKYNGANFLFSNKREALANGILNPELGTYNIISTYEANDWVCTASPTPIKVSEGKNVTYYASYVIIPSDRLENFTITRVNDNITEIYYDTPGNKPRSQEALIKMYTDRELKEILNCPSNVEVIPYTLPEIISGSGFITTSNVALTNGGVASWCVESSSAIMRWVTFGTNTQSLRINGCATFKNFIRGSSTRIIIDSRATLPAGVHNIVVYAKDNNGVNISRTYSILVK